MTVTLKIEHVAGSQPVVFQRWAGGAVETQGPLKPGETTQVTVWAGDTGKLEIVEPGRASVVDIAQSMPIDDPKRLYLTSYPDPTAEDLGDPEFQCIWEAIKKWDIARDPSREAMALRAGATGNDVMHILRELRAIRQIG
jgi:hypothetical protein